MKFIIFSLVAALIAVSAAAPLVESDQTASNIVAGDIEARADPVKQIINLYSGTSFTGFQNPFEVTIGKCRSLGDFKDNVRSANGFGDFKCTFYRQTDCDGVSQSNDVINDPNFAAIKPEISDFRVLLQNHARSVKCVTCPACAA